MHAPPLSRRCTASPHRPPNGPLPLHSLPLRQANKACTAALALDKLLATDTALALLKGKVMVGVESGKALAGNWGNKLARYGPPPPPPLLLFSVSDTVCVLRFNQVWHRE